ncbi:anthrone oxygenase family protein [Clavibacter michiganensis]|uniref:anthrone oxygenase family protein n=1 Tax=Clavibacter michiganensis TaxID=28447 RepID=UPI0005BABBA3|nr:anthrone oxygenase family protein [Clavibacter michiganensis]
MSPDVADAALVVAITVNGVLAGLYLAFAVAVSPGLRRVDARTHVRSIVAVNRAILNPVFLGLFLGAPVSALASLVLPRGSAGTHPSAGTAALACAVLALVVTVAVNVPLNRALERAEIGDDAQVAAVRERFARRWDRANAVRTSASFAATLLLACVAMG